MEILKVQRMLYEKLGAGKDMLFYYDPKVHERRFKRSLRSMEAVLVFIDGYIKVYDYPPTVREIVDGTHLTSNRGVSIQLDRLKGLGLIRFTERKPRRLIGLVKDAS